MSERTLVVWWGGCRVGELRQDRHGDMSFAYASDWLARGSALSRSLPLRGGPFSRHECRPFFGGLLPEERQRDGAAQALHVSRNNDFALLDALGGDVAGALTLLPESESPPPNADWPMAEPLTDAAFAAVLDQLPHRPLLAGMGLRMSLAGAQAKLPVLLVDDVPALPAPGQPTTHIVKPASPHYPGSVANEAWCMTLARTIGLHVATVEARVAAGRHYLLVERSDRARAGDAIVRLHQEDACQALGIAPERKYAGEGGPAMRDLFALARDYARQPARDVAQLVDAAIFNLTIGNADAHGKNFSFLLDDDGPRLAPFYDLLSTIAWPELSGRLAMRIGRAGELSEVDARSWARFADDAGITQPYLRRRVDQLSRAVEARCAADPGEDGIGARTALRAQSVRQSLSP